MLNSQETRILQKRPMIGEIKKSHFSNTGEKSC